MSSRFTRTASGGRLIPLTRPLKTHGSELTSVTLRAPRWNDYMELGEIHIPSRSGDTVAIIDDNEAIRAYAERLMDSEASEFKIQIHLVDAMAIKDAIKDFFEEGRSATRASTSSSTKDGAPAISET